MKCSTLAQEWRLVALFEPPLRSFRWCCANTGSSLGLSFVATHRSEDVSSTLWRCQGSHLCCLALCYTISPKLRISRDWVITRNCGVLGYAALARCPMNQLDPMLQQGMDVRSKATTEARQGTPLFLLSPVPPKKYVNNNPPFSIHPKTKRLYPLHETLSGFGSRAENMEVWKQYTLEHNW